MPTLVPAITIRNPKPYPKFIPANHIEGADGSKKTGNKPMDAISTNTRVCVLKVNASQSKTGIITYQTFFLNP